MTTRAEDNEHANGEIQNGGTDPVRVSSPAINPCSRGRIRALKTDDECWNDVLERACSDMSDATTPEIVEVANSEELQKSIEDLSSVYFKTWKLHSTGSILIYMLLNFFVLRQECCELKADRGNYEDHIAQLKKRVADLEDENGEIKRLRKLEKRGGRRNPEFQGEQSSMAECSTSGGDQGLNQLTQRLQDVTFENSKLKRLQDELYRINQQWALDYDSLTQRVTANTSFSLSSTGSYPSCSHTLEQPSEGSQLQVAELTNKLERLQEKMEQDCKKKDEEIKHLEDTNRAIQIQLQELGDLQVAMTVKEDHGRLQRQHQQLQREHQDLVCERLRLNKQLEKVRQAFLHLFPFGTPHSSLPRTASQYNTVPKRSCRLQYYHVDPSPPTPPGLIARGIQHQDSMVERDLQKPQPQSDDIIRYDHATNGATSLGEEPRTWPELPQRKRPETLVPAQQVKCPSCSKVFSKTKDEFDHWFEHIQFCGV